MLLLLTSSDVRCCLRALCAVKDVGTPEKTSV